MRENIGHLSEKKMPSSLWLCLLHLYEYITSKKIREAQDMAEQERGCQGA